MRPPDADLVDQVHQATDRVLRDAERLTEEQAESASLCPGWTRKHVLTHLAREADGLVNLLTWARTGVVTPMYPDAATMTEDIVIGGQRGIGEIVTDLRDASALLHATMTEMPDEAWFVTVRLGPAASGSPVEARELLWRRMVELELRHVDLDGPYTAAHWPEGFAERLLDESIHKLAQRDDVPPLHVQALDTGWTGSTVAGREGHHVQGPTRGLACWITGRSNGDGLHAVTESEHLTTLPELPRWI